MDTPKDFPWRPAMVTVSNGVPARLVAHDGWWHAWNHSNCWIRFRSLDGHDPDPTDGATIGALAAAVREAYHDDALYALCNPAQEGDDVTSWQVREPLRHGSRCLTTSPTEFAAWLAAWNARPKDKA